VNPATSPFDLPTLHFSGSIVAGPVTTGPAACNPIASARQSRAARSETTAARLVHQQRLVDVLRGTVEGFDLKAAELHLLTDASAELCVAADYGDGPTTPRRALETAAADLAALAGGAVVLTDQEMLAEWNVAYPCRAAVCLPVASDITIHGTLWLYAATARDFSDPQVQLLEIIAGRLAVEVERRQLLLG